MFQYLVSKTNIQNQFLYEKSALGSACKSESMQVHT